MDELTAKRNEERYRTLRNAIEERGYAAVVVGHGARVHAATQLLNGHSGYKHPRALCKPHSSNFYACFVQEPAAEPVTCVKCQVILAGKNLL